MDGTVTECYVLLVVRYDMHMVFDGDNSTSNYGHDLLLLIRLNPLIQYTTRVID